MRTIIDSPKFAKERDELFDKIEDFDELVRGVEDLLSLRPEEGTIVLPGKIWGVALVGFGRGDLVLFYSFTETHAYRLSIIEAIEFED